MKEMIHPQYWSIDSILRKVSGRPARIVTYPEARIYVNFLEPKGKIVLDVGASEGDTAELFLKHGAAKVICVEPTRKVKNILGAEIYQEKFSNKHLLLDYDLIKFDAEGYEMELLPFIDKLSDKRILIESHNHWINEQFLARGFEFLTKPEPMLGVCLMGKREKVSPRIASEMAYLSSR